MHRVALLTFILGSFGAFAAGSAFGQDGVAPPAAPVKQSELLGYLVEPTTFTLIDARSATEFAAEHVSGARNIPHDKVEAFAAELPADLGEPIVVYCRTGKRAALLADELRARGYTQVRTLRPDQLSWSDELVVFNCAASDTDTFDSKHGLTERER